MGSLEPGVRDTSERAHRGLHARAALQRCAPRFAAENEARMEAMAAAHKQIERSFPHCRRRSGLYDRRRSRRKS